MNSNAGNTTQQDFGEYVSTDSKEETQNDEKPDVPGIISESFNDFWFEQTAQRNIEENHPERNDPSHSWPKGRFEPHMLGNCKRKWFYRWLNAPDEEQDPHGIFAIGHFIEEEVIEPWLKDVFEPELKLDNAIHVSVDLENIPINDLQDIEIPEPTNVDVDVPEDVGFNQSDNEPPEIDADEVCLTIAGSTDPVVKDPDTDEILLLTEVKSTGSIDRVNSPKRMHLMQIHAYMKSLGIDFGYMIYVDKDDLLDPKVFPVEFDDDVWDTIVEWVNDTAAYAFNGELPPANPPEGWMCNYCEFANRCGKGRSNLAEDLGVTGFVPGYTKYPRNKVKNHLEAYPDTPLTPSLALKFPDLTDTYSVDNWQCPNCTAIFEYTDEEFTDFDNDDFGTPECPACKSAFDKSVYLRTESQVK